MNEKYKLGEKIKKRRIELGLTQKALCGEYITRNMLSLIESDSANPSIDTLIYLSEKLEIPLSFLFSDDADLIIYKKAERIGKIRELFSKGDYEYCLELISSLSFTDDELDCIHAYSAFKLGKKALCDGKLVSAVNFLNEALELSEKTVYPTEEIKTVAPLYLACATNIQSPLLELDQDEYERMHASSYDYEFYKYISVDTEYEYQTKLFRDHVRAKVYMKKYMYTDAISILRTLEDQKNSDYNAYAFFSIYSDLESAYRQIGDFENAYRYSSKRMSLMSAFKS